MNMPIVFRRSLSIASVFAYLVFLSHAVSSQEKEKADDKRISQIRPLLADADKAAKAWKSDAALFGINLKAESDGTIDLTHLAAPPQFDGGLVTVTYRSISAVQSMTFVLNSKRQWDPGPPLPISADGKAPVPADFLDIDEAFAQAKGQDMK